jgi:hypothetical protein
MMVGLYFAVGSSRDDGYDGCLWALSSTELNGSTIGQKTLITHEERLTRRVVAAAFDSLLVDPLPIFALAALQDNPRMLAQQAMFTLHGVATAIEELPKSDEFAVKFVIPRDAKPYLRDLLNVMGFRRWNLFPDLKSLADELAGHLFTATS